MPITEFHKSILRTCGWLSILIALAEIALGILFGIIGTWWVGLFLFIHGFLGVIAVNRGVLIVGCVLSIFSIISSVIGIFMVSLLYNVYHNIRICVDTLTGSYYGSKETYNIKLLNQCNLSNQYDCNCLTSYGACYQFNDITNCSDIFTGQRYILISTVIIMLVGIFVSLFYSITACTVICSEEENSSTLRIYNLHSIEEKRETEK